MQRHVTADTGKEKYKEPTVSYTFDSDSHKLAGLLSLPKRVGASGTAGLILCHGFPTMHDKEVEKETSYYDFADLVAKDLGWIVLAFTYRGCGESEGNFSLQGWLNDTINAVKELSNNPKVNSIWLAGFGTGGALAITAASQCEEVKGVASISSPSDFNDWIGAPDDLLRYARLVGAISDPDFPGDKESWALELSDIQAVEAAENIQNTPLLVIHGASDKVVPSFDARVIADAHGAADLRIIDGGTHRLRFDPRATAVIMGWLDRTYRSQTEEILPSLDPNPKEK